MQQSKGIEYRGYVIRPAPLLRKDGRWNHELYVVRDKGYEVAEKKFSFESSSATRDEAITRCSTIGEQITDGNVPNCSVDDL